MFTKKTCTNSCSRNILEKGLSGQLKSKNHKILHRAVCPDKWRKVWSIQFIVFMLSDQNTVFHHRNSIHQKADLIRLYQ